MGIGRKIAREKKKKRGKGSLDLKAARTLLDKLFILKTVKPTKGEPMEKNEEQAKEARPESEKPDNIIIEQKGLALSVRSSTASTSWVTIGILREALRTLETRAAQRIIREDLIDQARLKAQESGIVIPGGGTVPGKSVA